MQCHRMSGQSRKIRTALPDVASRYPKASALGLSNARREAAYHSAEGRSEVRRTERLIYCRCFSLELPKTSKTQQTNMSSPKRPKTPTLKTHKPLKTNHLKAKNKPVKTDL
jgi:hypothetical protein